MRQHLSNLLRSPLALMLIGFLLALTLVLTEVRLQVAAYWETHPVEWRTSVAFEAADPGAVDFLTAQRQRREGTLGNRRIAAAQAHLAKLEQEKRAALNTAACEAGGDHPKGLMAFLCNPPDKKADAIDALLDAPTPQTAPSGPPARTPGQPQP